MRHRQHSSLKVAHGNRPVPVANRQFGDLKEVERSDGPLGMLRNAVQ